MKIAGSVAKSYLARQLGVAFDWDYYFSYEHRYAVDQRCNDYVAEALSDLPVFYTESNLGRLEYYGAEQVIVGGIQPNMIVGMLLGAEFCPSDAADADISPRCLAARPIASLPAAAELLAHPLVTQWQQEIKAIARHRPQRTPIPPFFWDCSGRAAIHGAVTSGLKFYGDEFLLELLTEPQQSARIVDWLTDISVKLVQLFGRAGDMPVHCIHVGECVACMLDVDSFRRFVVPAVSRLGRQFGGVRFHSCGCSDHLLAAWRDIDNLVEIDVGGETSMAKIRNVWGPEFPVGIAPLVEHMRASTTGPILNWLERVREENQDGNLTIGFHLEADYRIENLRALVEAVRRIG